MPELYSEQEIHEISDFIESVFGKYDYVFHEVASPDIHVDVAIIPPTEERNYCTLCTMGVGAHRMDTPDELRYESLLGERAELLIYLSADWKLAEEDLKDERNYWPIRLLKDFARMPINTESWIAWTFFQPRRGRTLRKGRSIFRCRTVVSTTRHRQYYLLSFDCWQERRFLPNLPTDPRGVGIQNEMCRR